MVYMLGNIPVDHQFDRVDRFRLPGLDIANVNQIGRQTEHIEVLQMIVTYVIGHYIITLCISSAFIEKKI